MGVSRIQRTKTEPTFIQRSDSDDDVLPHRVVIRAWMLVVPVDFVAATLPGLLATAHLRAFLALGVLCVALLNSCGRYRARLHLSTLDDVPTILGKVCIAAAVVSSVTALRHPSAAVADFVRWATLSGILIVLGRMITNFVILTARKRRVVQHSTVLLGCGPLGVELFRLLGAYPQYGLRVTTVVDAQPKPDEPRHIAAGFRVRPIEELDAEITRVRADVIIVADPAKADGALLQLVRGPAASSCDLLVVPRLPYFHTQVGFVDHIGAIPIMRIKSPALLGRARLLKRAFDLILTSVVLILASPVMLVAAIAVRLEGGTGVLFRQARITRDGRTFEVLKFRTMRPVDEQESASQWCIANDYRVGPVGRLLRRTSLDELPQLWNVLRGDMTLVGPRPERPLFVEQFSAADPRYGERHRVVCGLTGLAQVSGLRGDTSITDRARYDNFYIESWSPWTDVKVLMRTLGEIICAKGR